MKTVDYQRGRPTMDAKGRERYILRRLEEMEVGLRGEAQARIKVSEKAECVEEAELVKGIRDALQSLSKDKDFKAALKRYNKNGEAAPEIASKLLAVMNTVLPKVCYVSTEEQ